jgi:hypothetical protein
MTTPSTPQELRKGVREVREPRDVSSLQDSSG